MLTTRRICCTMILAKHRVPRSSASKNLVKELTSSTPLRVLCVHVAAALCFAPWFPPLTLSLFLSLYFPNAVAEQRPLYTTFSDRILRLVSMFVAQGAPNGGDPLSDETCCEDDLEAFTGSQETEVFCLGAGGNSDCTRAALSSQWDTF